MSHVPQRLEGRARGIRLLVLDVDGVLTDGRLHYGESGEVLKVFDVKDGMGIKLLSEGGIDVAVISARRAAALERRLADLAVTRSLLGRSDKLAALDELTEMTGVPREVTAFMGDDVLDLPALRAVSLAIAPADAHFSVRDELVGNGKGWVTQAAGGRGAVREVADGLLASRGALEAVVEAHLHARGG